MLLDHNEEWRSYSGRKSWRLKVHIILKPNFKQALTYTFQYVAYNWMRIRFDPKKEEDQSHVQGTIILKKIGVWITWCLLSMLIMLSTKSQPLVLSVGWGRDTYYLVQSKPHNFEASFICPSIFHISFKLEPLRWSIEANSWILVDKVDNINSRHHGI